MRFSRSSYRMQNTACARLAQHIAAAARAMQLHARVEESRQSASHYVYVAEHEDADEYIKVRCSDHSDRHGGSDIYAWTSDCPSAPIAEIAAHYGRDVPRKYRPEAYAARSAAAEAAARTRSARRAEAEGVMRRAVIDALIARIIAEPRTRPTRRLAYALIDERYPGLPRAQRQRIADDALYRASAVQAIAAANGDETALARLATQHDEARRALYALVGAERYAQLRPAGFPRNLWQDALDPARPL